LPPALAQKTNPNFDENTEKSPMTEACQILSCNFEDVGFCPGYTTKSPKRWKTGKKFATGFPMRNILYLPQSQTAFSG